MRLLKINGPGEFSLVQVASHTTLSYAILSHTWTDGQEVTYQDLISGAGNSKSGYDKIKFCGEQATRDGLQYFWVDTCCIDKSDPAELSKAINSMFRWYRNAKKCYVYLADVSRTSENTDVQASQSTWEVAFRGSKWFTRGWTLQELIAPAVVEFFSQEGKLLGDKKSLEKPIYEITQIPIHALRGNPFSDFSIAERKGWAAQRQTTEEEDIVYCLLGLCEVSMPTIYGEGKDAALKRLEMTVKGFSNDSSEPKDLKDNSVSFIVPFDRNRNFTGRGRQLAEVEVKLFAGGQTTKVAITGLGGIGKTQLVLEIVYRIRDRYKDCLVIWIPATNTESLHQAYLDVARQLKIPGSDEDRADAKKLVQGYLSKESAGRWLLVFDNADDVNMWITQSGPGSGRLIDYLPRSEQGCIVFTTRDRKTAVKLAHRNVVAVPELDEDVAVQLLQKCLINPDLVNNRPDTTALLKELTYLPLAIIQAAAYINENGIAFVDYLSLLAEQEEDVIDLLSEEFEDDGRYDNIKNPVATTWLISFEQIRHRDPLAADYLSFMACIDPKDIPQSLLPAGASRKKAVDAIGTLEAYSLIIKRAADLAVDLHRLVHLATRNWLQREDMIAQWTEMAIIRLEEVFPDDDHQNRNIWRSYLAHTRYVLGSNIIDQCWENRIKLARKVGMCLYSDGQYNEAEALDMQVMETSLQVLGQEHPDTLTSMANLAATYRDQGRWKEAEELQATELEICSRVLGQEHPSTLTSMSNLALTYRNQGRLKEAEDLGVQVIETRKRVLGAKHPSTLTSIANLASTYQDQGRWTEAEELQATELEICSRVLGKEHPDTLTSMANLASTYGNQGRWKEAEDLEVQVMETRKRVLGAKHPDTLTSIANLASTYQDQGRWTEAEELQATELEICSRVLGKEHPDTLTSMANLASTYQGQGRWTEAEELQATELEICSRVLGKEHPNTLTSMHNLALIRKGHDQDADALELMKQCVEAQARILGSNHPYTLLSSTTLLNWEAEKLETLP
ncbi:hypothetical protein ACEPPN_013964 [Leptodophora sp. 'Broadleaf-Isolate-01']